MPKELGRYGKPLHFLLRQLRHGVLVSPADAQELLKEAQPTLLGGWPKGWPLLFCDLHRPMEPIYLLSH
jgi:hypothetical protein